METVMGMQAAMMAAATGVTVGTAAIEPFSPSLVRREIVLPVLTAGGFAFISTKCLIAEGYSVAGSRFNLGMCPVTHCPRTDIVKLRAALADHRARRAMVSELKRHADRLSMHSKPAFSPHIWHLRNRTPMSLNKCLCLMACFSIASVLPGPGTIGVAAANNHHPHRVRRGSAVHHRYFGSYRPPYGYYTVHGQYVPGASDRLIYGPGYVFVPGHGILGEDCDMPTSTCPNEYRDIR
jgi:hypothetical protein